MGVVFRKRREKTPGRQMSFRGKNASVQRHKNLFATFVACLSHVFATFGSILVLNLILKY